MLSEQCNIFSYNKKACVKPKPFALEFSNWFSLCWDHGSCVRPFLLWFEYGMVCICLTLNLLQLKYARWTPRAWPYLFGTIELNLARCQDRVPRESSMYALCVFGPLLDEHSPSGTHGTVPKVSPIALVEHNGTMAQRHPPSAIAPALLGVGVSFLGLMALGQCPWESTLVLRT